MINRKIQSRVFSISLMLMTLSTIAHAEREFGPCQLLYHNYIYENIKEIKGRDQAELYDRIFINDYLHPNKKIRKIIYKYLLDSPEYQEILIEMEQMLPKDLERVAQLLKAMKPKLRNHVLSSQDNWEGWVENTFSLKNNLTPTKSDDFILIDGFKVHKKKHKELKTIKLDLEKKGVFSHITSGPELTRSGEGVLVIDRVEKRARAPKIHPFKPAVLSAEFHSFLTKAQSQNGAIIIHPHENDAILGYFWENKDVVPGKDWVIALKPDSTGGTFVHEWQHKMDRIDEASRYWNSLVHHQKLPESSQNRFRKALQNTGAQLETKYLSELNATAKELGLFFKARNFSPSGISSVMIYRAVNMKKVAIGRIFWDPLHPKHYALYLYAQGLIYLPSAVVLGTLGGSAFYGTLELLKMISDLSAEK